LVPNSRLRAAATACGRKEAASPQAPAKSVSATDEESTSGSPAPDLWAMLPMSSGRLGSVDLLA
jgi:hypothetical protein